ncbi:hypothetical protein [Planococcus salinarum]|uniref:hypothetical protein n=1 Tax=Planococcus salinarum TaxID=622695 RepID=UPI00115C6544|nr:hypothetical protein [Planococcus salinarum]TAA73241.1 hypothetical protein D2909_02710 [Planococcus salinarum]
MLKRGTIHPLILAGLFISSITMVFYAYEKYHTGQITLGIVFISLSIMLLGLAVYGGKRNRRIGTGD